VLKLAVTAMNAVPAPCTAHRIAPAVVPSASLPGSFDSAYESGDWKSSRDMQAC